MNQREDVLRTDGDLGRALFDDAFIQDPYPLYRRMHDHGPLHRIGTSDFYAVNGWDAVNEVVTRCADFSSNLTATMMFRPPDGIDTYPIAGLGSPIHALATADDPKHAIHRRALLPHLAAKRIREFDTFINDTAGQLWTHGYRDGGIEWMSAMANQLPMMIVARIIGIPDDDVETMFRWGSSATQLLEGLVEAEQMTAATEAVVELSGYINEQFRRASSGTGEGLIGDLADACARGEIDQTAAQIIMITLFSAGGESTSSLIGSAAWILASRPDIQQQVRADPQRLGAFLEEVLRYEPPFRGHYRHVVQDTELCGVALKAGARLLLLWGAANRDPAHFPDPDEFTLDRPNSKGHLSFGKGVHFCVGASLARSEASTVIGGLLDWTTRIESAEPVRWQSSLMVRRLERLELGIV